MAPTSAAYGAFEGPPSIDRAISELARRQHGIVAIAQLLDLGLTKQGIRRRLESGFLHRLHRGVYAVGHLALTASSRDLAAVFACGPRALLSHRSAGQLWGILKSSSPRIEVTAPRGIKAKPGITLHVSRVLEDPDRGLIDAIPVTSLARTLVDLAEVLDDARLTSAVNEAELLRLFDLIAVEATMARLPGRRGRRRMRRVLASYQPEPRLTRSTGERRLLALCRDHDLPTPQGNTWLGEHEVDLYWPDARLAVEFDGREVHGTTQAFYEDRRRDRALAAQGVQVTRVTRRDLDDEAALARELRRIREQRLSRREP